MVPEPPLDWFAWIDRAPAYLDDCHRGTLVFLVRYPGRGSGGLADVLHAGEGLRAALGLQVYYQVPEWFPRDQAAANIRWMDPSVPDDAVLHGTDFVPEFICATAWPTAYEALARPSKRKLYFVQDYEPLFRRAGVERTFAERSYGLGLEMITLGPWLAGHLERTHGVKAAHMPFPMMDEPTPGRPLTERSLVAIYLQPDKSHRGTELLVEAGRRLRPRLREVCPQVSVVVFGSDQNLHLQLDFADRVLGVLSPRGVSDLLDQARVGVCLSFTNVSLLTLQYVAHGCLAVDLNLPNVRENVLPDFQGLVRLVEPTPSALAAALLAAAGAEALGVPQDTKAMTVVAQKHSWPRCVEAFAGMLSASPRKASGAEPHP